MTVDPPSPPPAVDRIEAASGLAFEWNANGALRRIRRDALLLNLFVADGAEAGPANLWLRVAPAGAPAQRQAVPLLGPGSPLRRRTQAGRLVAHGLWNGLEIRLQLVPAASAPAWFWHLALRHGGDAPVEVDAWMVQDVGLASEPAVRLNEYFVSQYVDFTPLVHPQRGAVLAVRQNQAVDGRHPKLVFGAFPRAVSHATDGLAFFGKGSARGAAPDALATGLPGTRLQHEHALAALQGETLRLAPGASARMHFHALLVEDAPQASGPDDLALADALLALPEAQPPLAGADDAGDEGVAADPSLFDTAPMLAAETADAATLDRWFPGPRRHEERWQGELQSFFRGEGDAAAHVVLRAKEERVRRPHGLLLRSGDHLVPDEAALTSTVWMNGAFHSMVTQGHVGINRLLSTQRSGLGLFRAQGQRIFVFAGGRWQRLGLPSAFEMQARGARWLYLAGDVEIEVRAEAAGTGHALALHCEVHRGGPLRLRITHHLALDGDDGCSGSPPPRWTRDGDAVVIGMLPGSPLAERFPDGQLCVLPADGAVIATVGGDEMLFDDGLSRGLPFVCIETAPVDAFGLRLTATLVPAEPPVLRGSLPLPELSLPAGAGTRDIAQLADILPCYLQNALVHYLAPRGLEQFSGGGWGTRDVCQGPLEMLLALGEPAAVRDLLLRVFSAQNADGDWPQWFQFFERERAIRAGDSHGDIVFWPLLALARYLCATGDAALLDAAVPFHDGAAAPLAVHLDRALAVIAGRRIAGTALPAYGHGDWNDALQPADPLLRERLCSAWTATLAVQTGSALAEAMQACGRDAGPFETAAAAVRDDFRARLVRDGVVAGYGLFDPGHPSSPPAMLLHPQDATTGLRYSLLPMIHAIGEGLFTPQEARAHLALIERHLLGPDGARLFDAPLPYRGGPQRIFQRAESAAFFGREIGLMYTHAHLRYAEALAALGEAQRFLQALMQAVPIGLAARVPSAAVRQANVYSSSSDAAFADRYQALNEYARIADGTIALEDGWRVYSSGPGIFIGIVVERLLGLRQRARALIVDPVMPAALDGLACRLRLFGRAVDVRYRVGPAGCGPRSIRLDGRALAFDPDPRPYRAAGARIARAEIVQAPAGAVPLLEIEIG